MSFDPASEGWRRYTLTFPMRFGAQLWHREEAQGPAYGLVAGEQHLDPSGVVDEGLILAFIDQAIGVPGAQNEGFRRNLDSEAEERFLRRSCGRPQPAGRNDRWCGRWRD